MANELHDLPIGAHLKTPRYGYVHHGIYAGNGRVIHYRGFSPWCRRGPVEEVSLEEFAGSRGFEVEPTVARRFDTGTSLARARSRLGENRYRLWSNNCEHFVAWCILGASRSAQVDAWVARLRGPLSGLARLIALPRFSSAEAGRHATLLRTRRFAV